MLKCLYSSPRESVMISRDVGSGSTARRCSYQPIASASSVRLAHMRANVRVCAGSSAGGSWYWSNPMTTPLRTTGGAVEGTHAPVRPHARDAGRPGAVLGHPIGAEAAAGVARAASRPAGPPSD